MTTATLDALADVDTPPVDLDAPAPDLDAPAPTATRTRRGRTTTRARKPRSAPAASASPSSTPRKPRAPKVSDRDKLARTYGDAIAGILAMPVLPLAVLGKRNDTAAANAATLALMGPPFAAGLGQLAADVPAVGAIVERVAQAGPGAAAIATGLPLLAQVLVNLGVIPALPMLGTRSREEMVAYGRAMADEALTRAQAAPGQ